MTGEGYGNDFELELVKDRVENLSDNLAELRVRSDMLEDLSHRLAGLAIRVTTIENGGPCESESLPQTEAQEDRDPLGLKADPEAVEQARFNARCDDLRDAIGDSVQNLHLIVPFMHTRRVRRVIETIEKYQRFEAERKALDAILTEWACTGYGK